MKAHQIGICNHLIQEVRQESRSMMSVSLTSHVKFYTLPQTFLMIFNDANLNRWSFISKLPRESQEQPGNWDQENPNDWANVYEQKIIKEKNQNYARNSFLKDIQIILLQKKNNVMKYLNIFLNKKKWIIVNYLIYFLYRIQHMNIKHYDEIFYNKNILEIKINILIWFI